MERNHQCLVKRGVLTVPLSCKLSGFTDMASAPVAALTSSLVAPVPPATNQ